MGGDRGDPFRPVGRSGRRAGTAGATRQVGRALAPAGYHPVAGAARVVGDRCRHGGPFPGGAVPAVLARARTRPPPGARWPPPAPPRDAPHPPPPARPPALPPPALAPPLPRAYPIARP